MWWSPSVECSLLQSKNHRSLGRNMSVKKSIEKMAVCYFFFFDEGRQSIGESSQLRLSTPTR
jgi:hypothetical protein